MKGIKIALTEPLKSRQLPFLASEMLKFSVSTLNFDTVKLKKMLQYQVKSADECLKPDAGCLSNVQHTPFEDFSGDHHIEQNLKEISVHAKCGFCALNGDGRTIEQVYVSMVLQWNMYLNKCYLLHSRVVNPPYELHLLCPRGHFSILILIFPGVSKRG